MFVGFGFDCYKLGSGSGKYGGCYAEKVPDLRVTGKTKSTILV